MLKRIKEHLPKMVGFYRGQPAIEFFSVYSWAIISILAFVAVILVLSQAQNNAIYPPSHCFLTQSFPCSALYIMTNSIGTRAILIFTNNLGVQMSFPSNSFGISPTYANVTYYGLCFPANVLNGGVAICNATMPNYRPTIGSELNPRFIVSYKICSTTCSGNLPVYNTSGFGSLTITPYSSSLASFQLTESASPSAGGTVTPGTGYHNLAATVTISESTNTGYTFNGWVGTGTGSYSGTNPSANIIMTNPITEIATFNAIKYTLTMAVSPSGSGTVLPGTGSYSYGTSVGLSETPAAGYSFVGWVGTGTGSYTGNSASPTLFIANTVTETADFGTVGYTLTTGSSPTGSGLVSPSTGNYLYGNTVTISETPNPGTGYAFTSWSCTGVGCYSGTNTVANIVISGPMTETANYQSNSVAGAPLAYVMNSASNNVVIINTATNTITGAISTGFSYPIGVAFSPSGTYAYGVNCGQGNCGSGGAGSNVVIINTATNAIVGTIPGGYSINTGVAISPNGNYAYISNQGSGNIVIVNTATNTITGAMTSGFSDPYMMAFSPSGTYAYVPNEASNNVVIVNTATNTVTGSITGGFSNPGGVAFSPTGAFAYVANFNGGSGGNVVIINTATNTVTGSITGAAFGGPIGIAMSPSGAFAYVTNQHTSNVIIINTATNTVTGSINSGFSTPYGVAMLPTSTTCNGCYYTLTTSSFPATAGNVLPLTGNYAYGNTVTISETPNNGFTFTGWTCTGTGCYSGTNPSANIVITNSITETANYYGLLAYVPITITNSQSTGTGSPFQQLLTIPSNLYSTYINPQWNNVEFTANQPAGTAGNVTLDAWVESNASNTASATNVWVKLLSSISGNSNTVIYMDFMKGNIMSASGFTGEAPNLSSTYAQYDNGNSVFNFYDNFAGTSISSKWSQISEGSYTVNNGISLSAGQDFVSQQTFNAPLTVDAEASFSGSGTLYGNIGIDGHGGGGYETFGPGFNCGSRGFFEGSAWVNDNCGGTTFSPAPGAGYYVYTATYVSGTTSNVMYSYGNKITGSISATYVGTPFQVNLLSDNNVVLDAYWARERATPPNEVMPSFSLSSCTSCGSYTLTTIASPSADGSVSPSSGNYLPGNLITVMATPTAGDSFYNWTCSSDISCSTASNTLTFTMPANAVTVTANFGTIGYSFCENNGTTSASCTPSSGTLFICNGADGNGPLSSISWTADAQDFFENSSVGHQSSSTCSDTSSSSDIIVAGAGIKNPPTYYLVNGSATGSSNQGYTAFSSNYVVYASNTFTFISVACGWYNCTSITAPAGCSKLFFISGGDKYETSYAAVCTSQQPGTYSISDQLSGAGGSSIAAYMFTSCQQCVLAASANTLSEGNVVVNGVTNPSSTTYAAGTQMTVNAVPVSGYGFSSWSCSNDISCSTSSNTLTFSIPANSVTVVTANFGKLSQLSVSANTALQGNVIVNGVTNPSPANYVPNVPFTVNAVPTSGNAFISWSCTGGISCSTASNTLKFTMPANAVTVTANFASSAQSYLLTASRNPSAEGSIVLNGVTNPSPANYLTGNSITVNAIANAGYTFYNWTCSSNLSCSTLSNTLTFNMPSNTATITANFDHIVWAPVYVSIEEEGANLAVIGFSNTGNIIDNYSLGNYYPGDIAIDSSGNIWITNDNDPGNVIKLSPSNTLLGNYAVGNDPLGIAIDSGGNAWIANDGNNTVTKLSNSGTVLGSYAVGNSPGYVAIDGGGNVFVTNYLSTTVTKLSNSGNVLGTYMVGNNPEGIAIDSSGDPWVVNQGDGTVTKLSNSGSVIGTYTISGSSSLQNIAIGSGGNAWITDRNRHQVTELSSSGSTLGSYTTGYFNSYITVDDNSNIWVTGTSSDPYAVIELSNSGNVLNTFLLNNYAGGIATG